MIAKIHFTSSVNTYLLRDLVQPKVVDVMGKFMDDPNLYVQNNALYCLVANQCVTAIPRLIQLRRTAYLNGEELDCALSLQKLTVKSSIPYLNNLLIQRDESLRINSMFALPGLADSTSIPYLILALRDPDPQGIVSYGAYISLQRLVATLESPRDLPSFLKGRSVTLGDFIANREHFTRPFYDWWNDELMGIHFRTAEQAAGGKAEQTADKVQQLNLSLFKPDRLTRLKSIKLLADEANQTSIPFLVLALQDPDSSVAYGAYKILHHLVPALGAAKDNVTFSANRTAVSQPVYDWWRDELLEQHLPK